MLNVLQQAVRHGVRKVVFSSSGGAIYGEQEIFPAPSPMSRNLCSPMVSANYAGAVSVLLSKGERASNGEFALC